MNPIRLAALFGFLSYGCSAPQDPCPEPRYAGIATDEAWRSMVDAQRRIVTDDTAGANVMVPTEGQVFSASGAAPTFEWSSALATVAPTRGPWWKQIPDWIYGSAWAHGTPMTGDGHWAEVAIPDRSCPLRILTGDLAWQLNADEWDTLKQNAGKSITLTVTSAYFKDNRITEGPFRPAQARTFQVSP